MPTASLQIIRLIVTAAAARGVAPASLLAELDVPAAQLVDPDARIPADVAVRAWQLAAARCGDPTFGLTTVEHLRADALGGLGWAIHASATVREGLERLARFLRLGDQSARLVARLAIVEEPSCVRLQLLADPAVEHALAADELRHPTECLLWALVVLLRRATGQPIAPIAVAFRHPAPPLPDALTPYLVRFAVTPRFGAELSELILPRAVLSLPHLPPDPQLTAVTERHLRRLLDELPTSESFVSRARRALAEELRHGEPTLAQLASHLDCSERTLQRRLQQEATSLQALLDELRLELAVRHLRESKESIAEISFLLGFSEVRAFHRAFKRWSHATPAAFRPNRRMAAGHGDRVAAPLPVLT